MSTATPGSSQKVPRGALEGRGTPAARAPGAGPFARLAQAYAEHPLLVTWLALSAGMVPILLWASWNVDLLLRQRLVLVAATIGLAGLCAWIIGWERP